MAKQNIFDNEIFFEGYKTIRDKEGNANNLFEIPAIKITEKLEKEILLK